MSGLSWPPRSPLSPGDTLEASRVNAPRPLRPPPPAASHHRMLTPRLAATTGARDRAALLSASIHGPLIPPPSLAYTAATPWPNRHPWSAQAPTGAGANSHEVGRNCNIHGTLPAAGVSRPRPGTAY